MESTGGRVFPGKIGEFLHFLGWHSWVYDTTWNVVKTDRSPFCHYNGWSFPVLYRRCSYCSRLQKKRNTRESFWDEVR